MFFKEFLFETPPMRGLRKGLGVRKLGTRIFGVLVFSFFFFITFSPIAKGEDLQG